MKSKILLQLVFFGLGLECYAMSPDRFTTNRDFIVTPKGLVVLRNRSQYPHQQIIQGEQTYLNPNYILQWKKTENQSWKVLEVNRENATGDLQIAKFDQEGLTSYTFCIGDDESSGLPALMAGRKVSLKDCATATKSVCSTFADGIGGFNYGKNMETINQCEKLGKSQEQLKKLLGESKYQKTSSENKAELATVYKTLATQELTQKGKFVSTSSINADHDHVKGESDLAVDGVLFRNLARSCWKWFELTHTYAKPPAGQSKSDESVRANVKK